jgi:hypothetical protein
LAVVGARVAERRLTGPLGRARRVRVGDTDAAAWYAGLPAGGRAAQPARRSLRRWARTGQAAAVLLSLALVVTIGEAVAASVSAVLSLQRLGPKTAELLADQARIQSEDPLATARAAWAPLLPAADSVPDSTARAWVRALADTAPSGPPPFVPRPSLVLGRSASALARAFQAAAAGTLRPGLRDSLAGLAAEPRTGLFRRIARAPLAGTEMAELGNPFAPVDAPRAARAPRTAQLQEAALANTAGAIVAVAQHDLAAAERRIGENAAFAEQLLKAPDVGANQLAFRILRDLVVEPLGVLVKLGARDLDAPAVRDAAQHLDEAMPYTAGAAGLTVNPRDLIQFTAAVRNPRIPTGFRVVWLYEGWAGLCANPWELLTGPSAARRQAMLSAADVMSDVPRARDLALADGSQWALGAGLAFTGWRRAFLDRGPLGLLWRMRMCTQTL